MSKVWRARDRDTGQDGLPEDPRQGKDAKLRGALRRPEEAAAKAKSACCLQHRNIVQTFEHGLTTKEEPYIIMELVDGVGLNFLIETKHKDLEGNRIKYLTQFADALEYHAQRRLSAPRHLPAQRHGRPRKGSSNSSTSA